MHSCFVIMSFEEQMGVVYHTIAQAARNKGYHCSRADIVLGSDDVPDSIIKSIVAADVVVADLTQSRPNVYFELGVAYSTCRPTVCICQNVDLPFDVRNYRMILYDPSHLEELRLKLQEAFDNLDSYVGNPVTRAGKEYFDLRTQIRKNLEATVRDRKRAGELSDFLQTEWAENEPVADALIDGLLQKCRIQGRRVGIAVSGAGSIGKSTFSKLLRTRLEARFPDLITDILPTDAYMMDRSERLARNITGFDIRAHDLRAFEDDLHTLMSGEPVRVCPYDHGTGSHGEPIEVRSPNILILEGIHSFHPPLKDYVDYSVFIYSTKFVVKELKFLADALSRGYSPATAFEHSEREYQDYEEHVYPYYLRANAVVFVEGYWRYRFGKIEGTYRVAPNNGQQRPPLLRRR